MKNLQPQDRGFFRRMFLNWSEHRQTWFFTDNTGREVTAQDKVKFIRLQALGLTNMRPSSLGQTFVCISLTDKGKLLATAMTEELNNG